MKVLLLAAAAAVALAATSAQASITVDGTLDAAYGASTASVAYDPGAPLGNFGSPGTTNHNVAYDIYLHDEGGTLYGFLQAAGPTNGLDFANLYFDIDPANNNGSDLGFEVTNDRAFVPGMAGYSGPLGLTWALGTNSLEFAISNSLFEAPIPGLTYYGGQEFPGAGDPVVLRLSQSFGYSVAGGPDYGPNRLGAVTLSDAVPEPAAWALMLAGFFGAGAALRSSRRKAVLA